MSTEEAIQIQSYIDTDDHEKLGSYLPQKPFCGYFIDGEPICLYTCKNEAVKCLKVLLQAGWDRYEADKEGLHPLLAALQIFNLHMVDLLLDGWTYTKPVAGGNTALILACRHAVPLAFLKDKLSLHLTGVNLKNDFGETALHYAAQLPQSETCDFLLLNGAQTTVNNYSKRGTALHYACEASSAECIDSLLRHGAHINAKTIDERQTPLHIIAKSGMEHRNAINLILENNPDLNQKDRDGNTPLMTSIRDKNFDITLLLLEKCADVALRNRDGEQAIHFAAKWGYDKLIVRLLAKGAQVNSVSNNGSSPLHLACEHENFSCATILFCHVSNLNTKRFDGRTALDLAAKILNFKLFETLKWNGASGNLWETEAYKAAFERLCGFYTHSPKPRLTEQHCALYLADRKPNDQYRFIHLSSQEGWNGSDTFQVDANSFENLESVVPNKESLCPKTDMRRGEVSMHSFDHVGSQNMKMNDGFKHVRENIEKNRELLMRAMNYKEVKEALEEFEVLQRKEVEVLENIRHGNISGCDLLLNYIQRMSVARQIDLERVLEHLNSPEKNQGHVVRCIIDGIIPDISHITYIDRNRKALRDTVDIIDSSILDQCISNGLICDLEAELIKSKGTRHMKTEVFLDMLCTKPAEKFWDVWNNFDDFI